MILRALLLILALATATAAAPLPDVLVLRRTEVPGALRVAVVVPYSADPDTIEAIFGVTASEPVVRKMGDFHSIEIPLPAGVPAREVLSVRDDAGELVTSWIGSDKFVLRVRTAHRPTVSKRGEQWFFLVTYFLE